MCASLARRELKPAKVRRPKGEPGICTTQQMFSRGRRWATTGRGWLCSVAEHRRRWDFLLIAAPNALIVIPKKERRYAATLSLTHIKAASPR
jgi:hypothetical protein